jgi:predicted Zn-dependent peptidase
MKFCRVIYKNVKLTDKNHSFTASGYLAEDTAGLAHFVEHLIFEGSEEYPGNDYQT